MRPRLLVLLGPPGSGKSHLGELAARTLDLDFVEHEAELIERWGSLDAFVANKRAALSELEASLRSRIESGGRPVVFESTGLSDRPMLERLTSEHSAAIVRVTAPRQLCVDRVRSRPKGRHFSDDAAAAGNFHDLWTREIAPGWDVDLDVVNDVVSGDADSLVRTEAIIEAVRSLVER